MIKKVMSMVLVAGLLSVLALTVFAQDEEALESPLMDDFESEELFSATDEFNNPIGHVPWGDTAGNVELGLAEVERDGEMTSALEINYDISAWGGFTHALSDGENWINQNWLDFNAMQFSLYGNNTGGIVQVEIFDNRNPSLNSDTAERWYFRITDDYEGWQEFTIAFDDFQRRTDFQPGGAPNDGFGLDAVSGYAFGMPAGTGAQTAYLDNVTLVVLETAPIIIDDFEIEELFAAQDANGTDIGFVTWGDTADNVELRLIDAIRGSSDTRALAVDYDVNAFGGFTHVFNDGESMTGQNWTSYNTISFWVLGSNTGEEIQFEIFDNRASGSTGDTAERYFYRFVDDSFVWKLVEIPFTDFQRRSDFQPSGAPDDGFNLNDVSGYAFGMPVGTGGKVLVVDDIRLISLDGVGMPDGVAAVAAEEVVDLPPPVELESVEPNPDLLEPIPFAEPMMITDFENGLPFIPSDGLISGFIPFGDSTGNVLLGIAQIQPFTPLALPDQASMEQVFRIDFDIAAYGGFTYALTDGEDWTSQDWTDYNALQFSLYGNNTGQAILIEIFDNRIPDTPGDTAERYFYFLADDFEGWQTITIPFAFFQRRTDYQPGPDDGFGLNEVSGYAFSFPAGVGAQTAYLDDVQVVVVEDPSTILFDGEEPAVTSIEIDESITWDSREWELVWSDEFDEESGTPINTEYWTCEEGGGGWGNNQLEFNTSRIENVYHNGDGQLVIQAREEAYDGGSCWYGECEYTSARCNTKDKVEFTHGRVEARMKIPEGQGLWPAFWMLGAQFPEVPWPAVGEIDIMENVGFEPNTVHGTLHGPGYSGGSSIGNGYTVDEAFADDFHVFAIDWDPYVIRWYVDGELYSTLSINTLQSTGSDWVYEQDFFMIMNVAVGGFWPGNPDETTVFPQQMEVDYIRVYELTD